VRWRDLSLVARVQMQCLLLVTPLAALVKPAVPRPSDLYSRRAGIISNAASHEHSLAAAARAVRDVEGVFARCTPDGSIEFHRTLATSQPSPSVDTSAQDVHTGSDAMWREWQKDQFARRLAKENADNEQEDAASQAASAAASAASAASAMAALAAVMTDTRRQKLQERLLPAEEVAEKLAEDESVVLIDLRAPGEIAAEIPGTESHPLGALLEGLASTPPFGGEWPASGMGYFPVRAERTPILMCADGEQSLVALDVLVSRYAHVYAVEGGVPAWEAVGQQSRESRDGGPVEL